MKWKKTFIFLLFFITGITLGALLSELVKNIPYLNWLNFGQQIGIGVPNPITLDLSVIKLSFGFAIDINIIKMVCIILGLWLYKKFAKGL
ncbi:DUF4321 domain-containing protein [Paludicola sp. MB14-C6]|uniref:DUF4321 domain-containing protein n=1 Tax=Paludihabitans sp. MB14-C6 TaxID=3070656 RepID=UPI0027DC743F|nr:DUF4321 domain-containing protein [Paludicola sp. MB14-C6]WMJ21814.1 DUF4321 domain-containing protein [Paludicola sp. MB14-C6]